ncbi:MAG: ketopantoate reductase family protein [Lachnospira sp.]|nr:ketopantoate reductase family protein [Lachnospira sp.]
MKIAVIGPGSMGLLYGTKLSKVSDLVLIGHNKEHVEEINEYGIDFTREEKTCNYKVRAVVTGSLKEKMDLVILFTKAYITRDALLKNKDIIGKDTFVLSLQNGAGHEEILSEFVDEAHVLIGTTTQGSSRQNFHSIINSGLGDTTIGQVSFFYKKDESIKAGVDKIISVFNEAGFPTQFSEDILFTVWNKLMINASSSVLSGILQKPQGYVVENEAAWGICVDLIKEICKTANSLGCNFKEEEQIERIRKHLQAAPMGFTSVYADIKNNRKTEADYISGAVVRAAKKKGIATPTQEMMLRLVNAMHDDKQN